MAQTEFEFFRDISYETNNKPEEIKRREEESLNILPRWEIPITLPHEVARGVERLLPHELLGGHWLDQRKAKWSADYLGLHPLEPWQEGSSKPIRPNPAIRARE